MIKVCLSGDEFVCLNCVFVVFMMGMGDFCVFGMLILSFFFGLLFEGKVL